MAAIERQKLQETESNKGYLIVGRTSSSENLQLIEISSDSLDPLSKLVADKVIKLEEENPDNEDLLILRGEVLAEVRFTQNEEGISCETVPFEGSHEGSWWSFVFDNPDLLKLSQKSPEDFDLLYQAARILDPDTYDVSNWRKYLREQVGERTDLDQYLAKMRVYFSGN